jgi:hypothetical protein
MNPTLSRHMPLLTLVFILAAAIGCEKKDPNHPEIYDNSTASNKAAISTAPVPAAESSPAAASLAGVHGAEPADYATDAWIGQWYGPEGTFLSIEGDKGTYKLTIQNLDGPKEYTGKTLGDRIKFDRDGTTETIHTSDGKDAGMKWMADKKNCLMIRTGEAYCRD